LTIKFNDLFALITQLNLKVNINNKTVIKRWLKQYIILGYNLGFNINDIRQAYFAKNKINFDRQNNNY
jgi:dimeric dUTPase (all-alpha-NTP-PPase superfamily)